MKFLSKLKGSLKRGFTVLCATVMVLTSGILTGTEFQASAAKLNGSVYLSDALYRLSGNKYKETKEQWQAFLTEYSTGGQENYYLGTPYNSSLYAASPKGNQWQGYSGMNCQGFVWYIISHGLAYYNKVPVSTTSPYVPNLAKFNQMGYSYKCWDGGGWYAFITQNNLHYYEFSDKDEMLKSGVLQKGDIIWCVNKASGGTGLTGLGNRDKNHHIGIYMGDGKSDSWWQSGPVNGNGIISVEKNSINPIYGKAETNTYVVIPWAEQKEAPHFDPTFLRIQKLDSETEKIEKIDENEVKAVPQNKISSSLEGAEFTMKYYPGTSATGNPTRTWTLVTDSKGAARLDKDHLKSGTLFTDNDGDAYLPLGTVVIKESKAPTGYKLSGLERTLHIVEKNGKAVIQEAGTEVKYVANFKEDIVRGDLNFNKVDGNQRSLAYIPFLLTNTDTGEKHIIMTDVHGKFSSKSGRGQLNDLDDYLQFLSTDENGDLKVPDAITNEAITQLGVWFGDESKADRTKGALICGHYKLQELRCKNNAGYKLITRQFFISSGVTDYSAGTLIDTTNPGNIVGKKVDEDGNGLAGAVLGLFTPDTTEFTLENTYTGMTAVSGDDGSFTFEDVPNGKYVVHEITPPDGYLLSDKSYPVTVKVNKANEEVQLGEDIVNHPTTIEFFKVDEDGNALSGAKMSIFELGSTSVVDSWTTDSSSHIVTAKLAVGKKYEYWESAAPDGYIKADPIYFTIQADGSVTDLDGNPITLQMVDHATQVEISKYNDNEEPLSGAKMQILDSDKNVVEEWITDGTTHVIHGKLIYGKTYTLHEAAAPTGYYTAEDMEFTVGKDTVSIGMVDDATWAGILKTDDRGHDVIGAVLQVKDKSGNVIEEWTTDGTRHEMRAVLNPDETYILHEVSAPEGYFLSEDLEFTVGQRVIMEDVKQTGLTVGKLSDIQEQTAGQELIFLPGAKLQIIDKNGNVLDEWTTENAQHQINKVLTPGETYTLHEVSAPDGYCVAEDIHFTLNDKGEFVKSDDYESGEMWIRMYDLATKIEIQKTDENGKPLSGAALQVIAADADGKETLVDSWITDGSVHQIYGKLIAGQTYILREASAPKGYAKAADQQFTVGTDGKVQNITMQDVATKVGIDKVDEDGKPLSGAVLQLLDAAGTEVEQWTTDGTTHRIDAVLTAGAEYTLHEVSAPDGYCVAADQKFTVNADGSLTSVKLTDVSTKVQISKTTITGDTELEGAKLEVRDLSGNALDSWTSGKEAHMITAKLTAGQTYVLHETAAPNGYVVSNDIEFTVNADGTVTKVIMKDDTTKVEISKKAENGLPLSGAKMQLLDKDGKEVDAWTTDGKAHTLTAKLTAGATYTLHEVSAPAGYCKAADQSFVVPADGSKKILTMTDLATRVTVEKLDADSKPLSGAKLQLLDKNGDLVDEWTSDGKAHTLTAKLTAGETYTLREAASPDGYYKAKDITFTVNADGTANEVALYNAKTRVSISKYDITGEKEIPGAKLEVRDKNDNVLDSWTSTGKAHEIVGVLVAGQTYVLHESVPADGYVVANDVEFTVNPDGTVTVVAMYDDTTKVEINKVTEDDKPLSGAKMQIIDKAGTVVDEWLTDGTAHVLTAQLISGQTYTLHEVSAPAGYVVSPDQQFTVNTDGSVTSVSMTDIATVVRVDKVDPDGKPLSGATLQILDKDENVLDEWITDGTTHTLTAKLTAGQTYTLREAAAPAGYYTAADSTFTVNLDGTPNAITLYNIKTKVEITKYDITGTNPLPGAKLQVKDLDGNVMDEWTSTDKAHLIEGVLVSGQTYILHEETAPDGYVLASDMQFTVNPDGTITTVAMKDDTTKVSITKKDITGENEITGATLEVWDMQGNVIDSWVSDGTAHEISGILTAGAKYILHEVSAPDGYVVATDVEFTVDANGNVTEVTMLDDTTKLHVTKKDITGEKELAGAALEVKDTDGNIIDAWVSDGTEHQIIGVLAVGKKYILHEVSAPNGYVVAEDVEFEVNADGSITRVEMRDDTTKVAITKYEITGEKELPGASMQLLDSKGNVVDAWISTDKAHEIIGVLTAGETYTLHEVSAPNGYVVAADASFTVNTDGSINVVSMYDDTTKVSISKTDITTGAALAGATLQIIDQNDNVIEEWVSTEEAHLIEAVLTAGETYTLRETSAPAGYVIAEDVSFTVNPDGSVTHVEMQDDTTKVSISKTDITGEKELAGAALEVRDANDNVIDAWVSDGTAHQINGVLVAGQTYTLHEVSAPNGYVVAEDVTFTVNEDGSVNMVSMVDAPTSVHISKKDITTGEELPGAFLELYDKDNNLVDSWVSTNEAHIIEAVLIAGEKYTLIETSAPNGYVISEKVEFTVNLDNTITHVEMLDKTTKVQISKKAITGEDELPGAVMQVLDKDNNIIDQWTSGSEPHMIEGVLIAGQTYVLHEVSAPAGYTLAKDVEFTVSETGEIDYVQMIDDTTKVSISKTDITGEKNVSGATLQIIDKNGNVIHEWISGTDVNYMEAQLTAGETYTLHETNAPAGYVLAQDQQFTVNADGTVTKVNMKDDTTKVSITKYDLTSGKELPGATLQIIDKDGNVIEEWVSTSEAHLIEGILTAGETYTLREISAPNGWTISEDVTFTVNADGTITHVEMYDKPTSVSLRKVDTDGNDIKGAVMQLLDKDKNVIEEWTTDGTAHVLTAQLIAGETYTLHEKSAPAGYELAKDQTFTVPDDGEITVTMTDEKTPTTPPVATPTTPTSTATPKTTSTPKTGDATPVMAIGTGLLASFFIMLLTRRKKRRNRKAA